MSFARFGFISFCLLLGPEIAAAQPAGGGGNLPEWIWGEEGREAGSGGRVVLSKSFAMEDEIEGAWLKMTTDFAHAEIAVNGEPVAALEAYDPPLELDVRHFLRSGGDNRIEIIAEGVAGPSAVAAAFRAELKNGRAVRFVTDSSWRSGSGRSVASYGKVLPQRWALNRLPDISPFAEYNQWKEAVPDGRETISPLPPGFEIERLRVAREEEGSWVSLAIDGEGRLIIAREERGLLRLTLPESGEGEIAVEVINDTLKECRGLVSTDGGLFANANQSKGLYLLPTGEGSAGFDEVALLRQTEGGGGHGRNDIVLGPDARIHAIHGDSVLVPDDAERLILSERGAPKELGHWVSTTGSGGGWRIHARGLRNPFGIDFNPDGEPFTYDADNEGDVGLPFYRPTRINHLVSGANYGWLQDRGNTRNLTVYAPDSVPTTFDVGRGSPTAVKFGTRSRFPQKYREALFALDWAYGRIVAVQLTPRGASYYGSGEVFLEGRPLNVTDLDFDAKGAMVFITGGRKTQSALYRVRYTGELRREDYAPTAQESARSVFSAEARNRRRQLERYHGNPGSPDFEDAWDALGDPDPWIRNAARVAIEKQALDRWRSRSLEANGDLQGLTALLALARAGSEEDREAAMRRVSGFDEKGWRRTEFLSALRIYEICDIAARQRDDADLIPRIRRQVEPWVDSRSDPVRREAIRILVDADSPAAVPAGLHLQAGAVDQLERLHYLEMLGAARSGWNGERRDAYFRAIVHAKSFSFGDRFMEGFFQSVENSALGNIGDEKERAVYKALLAERSATDVPDPGELPARDIVRHWKVDDFANDFDGSLGEERNLERGKELFDAVLCSRCHVAGTRGRPAGPDLTMVTSRFSRRDLLEAIIEPSKVVAEVHRNLVIRKKDGEMLQGRIIQNDFRKSLLYLSTNPFLPGNLSEIPKGDIESFEESPVSPMPPGLLDSLTREEVLDLVAWLEAEGRGG